MKKARKAMMLGLAAAMLVCVSVMGTIAYLTSKDSVANTFTVGNVAITLDEADVKLDGTLESNNRVEGNEYKLIPGQTYIKDPTMTVKAGSEKSYVRMKVTINCYAELKAIFGDDFLPENYVEGWDKTVWIPKGVDTEGNTVTYEFRYKETVNAVDATEDLKLPALFTSFTLPGTVTGTQLATIADLKIDVVGEAIQAATFADVDAAWSAFDTQNP